MIDAATRPSGNGVDPGSVGVDGTTRGEPGTAWDRSGSLGDALARFDQRVDAWMAPLRRYPQLNTAAAVISNLADYGAVWALIAGSKSMRPGPRRRRAVRALAFSGFSSLGVNTAVKAAVGRQRPATGGGPPNGSAGGTGEQGAQHRSRLPVRDPSSTSFPSGHTLAAFCTALVLPETGGEMAAAVTFAAAVALSRVHLRAHHASDVVGGAVIGICIGACARRVVQWRR